MDHPVVFIGGIHGVGKTSLSRQLAALLGAEHITAGALIRAAASPSDVVTVGPGNKAVPDVDANQERLLRGLAAHRAMGREALRRKRGLLLDGHFCLLNPGGHVVEIPYTFFQAINPVAVLLVESDLGTVIRRLLERDGSAPSVESLAALAECERTHATAVCAQLGIPLCHATGNTNPDVAAQLAALHLHLHLAPKLS